MRTIGKHGALFLLVMCSGLNSSNIIAAQQTTPGQELMIMLRTCLCDFNDKTPFSQFVAKMLKLLEDKVCATAIKTEYPNLNIPALTAALKKVQFKTHAMFIGFALKPFFKELPKDLQDLSTLITGLNKRLAIK